MRAREVGEKVKITVMRGSEEKTFEVTLGSDESLQGSAAGSARRGDTNNDLTDSAGANR